VKLPEYDNDTDNDNNVQVRGHYEREIARMHSEAQAGAGAWLKQKALLEEQANHLKVELAAAEVQLEVERERVEALKAQAASDLIVGARLTEEAEARAMAGEGHRRQLEAEVQALLNGQVSLMLSGFTI
jgi:MarR-like DNA-binding transcriptional regulator SgrR of sgrS sRNA